VKFETYSVKLYIKIFPFNLPFHRWVKDGIFGNLSLFFCRTEFIVVVRVQWGSETSEFHRDLTRLTAAERFSAEK